MEIDLLKPLHLFILDLNETETFSPLPKDFLRRCSLQLQEVTEIKVTGPTVALRGSSAAFGSWNQEGIIATELSKGQYAVVINEHIEPGTEYKWLDLSGEMRPGDIDPDTKYSHEPERYVNRVVPCEKEPLKEEEILIVFEKWGSRYRSKTEKFTFENWIIDEGIDDIDEEEEDFLSSDDETESKIPNGPDKLEAGRDANDQHGQNGTDKLEAGRDANNQHGQNVTDKLKEDKISWTSATMPGEELKARTKSTESQEHTYTLSAEFDEDLEETEDIQNMSQTDQPDLEKEEVLDVFKASTMAADTKDSNKLENTEKDDNISNSEDATDGGTICISNWTYDENNGENNKKLHSVEQKQSLKATENIPNEAATSEDNKVIILSTTQEKNNQGAETTRGKNKEESQHNWEQFGAKPKEKTSTNITSYPTDGKEENNEITEVEIMTETIECPTKTEHFQTFADNDSNTSPFKSQVLHDFKVSSKAEEEAFKEEFRNENLESQIDSVENIHLTCNVSRPKKLSFISDENENIVQASKTNTNKDHSNKISSLAESVADSVVNAALVSEKKSKNSGGNGKDVDKELSEVTVKRMSRISEADTPETENVVQFMVLEERSTIMFYG